MTGGPPRQRQIDQPAEAVARLTNGAIRLRALTMRDMAWLRDAETGEDLAYRWRLHGAHPSPRDHAEQVWQGVLALFVVEQVADGEPLGVLSAYQADHRNGHCRIAAARLGTTDSADTAFLAGIALFYDYLFAGWPFRKLYLETPEFNVGQFGSAVDRGLMRVEARLEEFTYLHGRYWDVLFLSVTRESWAGFRETAAGRRLVRQVRPAGDGSGATVVPAHPVGLDRISELILNGRGP